MTDIQPGVREVLESPEEGERVTLIVGVDPTSLPEVRGEVEGIGKVEEEVPVDCLAVNVAECRLQEICDVHGVTSVEIEGTWEAESEGNFDSQADSKILKS